MTHLVSPLQGTPAVGCPTPAPMPEIAQLQTAQREQGSETLGDDTLITAHIPEAGSQQPTTAQILPLPICCQCMRKSDVQSVLTRSTTATTFGSKELRAQGAFV